MKTIRFSRKKSNKPSFFVILTVFRGFSSINCLFAKSTSSFGIALLLGLFSLSACDNKASNKQTSSPASVDAAQKLLKTNTPPEQLSQQRHQQKNLAIVIKAGPHTYQADKDQNKQGLEFDLLQGFAKTQGLKLEVILAQEESEVLAALERGLADIALTGQPLSQTQSSKLISSSEYMDITTQLIYRHGNGKPLSFESLEGKRILVPNFAHYRDKQAFIESQHRDMLWEFSDLSSDAILAEIHHGKADYALMGSHEFLELRSKYPRTRVAFDLYYPEGLSFIINPLSADFIADALDEYIEQSFSDNTIARLKERYLGPADDVNPLGSLTFFKRINHRLPHYQDLIEDVAAENQLDWRLLAAIAYQESHWNPNAKSPTGVRGMMMLTQETAKDLGIENRLDLSQSLRGGARYFTSIYKRLPKTIKEPDRTWFALAAYNVGLGHIFDARKITEFHGADNNHWANVKQYLPLLEREEWYQYTRYGKARGSEPVNYVQNIRHFQHLLQWRFPLENRSAPTQISVKKVKELIQEPVSEAHTNRHG